MCGMCDNIVRDAMNNSPMVPSMETLATQLNNTIIFALDNGVNPRLDQLSKLNVQWHFKINDLNRISLNINYSEAVNSLDIPYDLLQTIHMEINQVIKAINKAVATIQTFGYDINWVAYEGEEKNNG
jgi:hypothetical protein